MLSRSSLAPASVLASAQIFGVLQDNHVLGTVCHLRFEQLDREVHQPIRRSHLSTCQLRKPRKPTWMQPRSQRRRARNTCRPRPGEGGTRRRRDNQIELPSNHLRHKRILQLRRQEVLVLFASQASISLMTSVALLHFRDAARHSRRSPTLRFPEKRYRNRNLSATWEQSKPLSLCDFTLLPPYLLVLGLLLGFS